MSSFRRRLARRWGIPDPVQPIPIAGPPATGPAPEALRVMVWNIQFGAGRDHLFFYDGGMAVSVPRPTVERTLDAIARRIHDHAPHLVLLQEVDRGSRRTHFIDQHAELARRLPTMRWHGSTPYHQVPYVPAPPHEHLGRVDMHLSVFARVPLGRGTRVQLPLLRESWVRRLFNLRRCVMEVPVLWSGRRLRVLHTHLSAFSHGDGTVHRQIAALRSRIAAHDDPAAPWLLAGDFNALPPGDDIARLGPDARMYGGWSPLSPLFGEARAAVPLDAHRDDPERWRTWVPYGASAPERAIDHAFARPDLRFDDVAVDRAAVGSSDHLPLLFTVRPEAGYDGNTPM